MESEAADQFFGGVLQDIKSLARKLRRLVASFLLATVAAWLSTLQTHANYSVWVVFMVVLLLSLVRRHDWVAGLVVAWFAVLYLLTPEMAVFLKALRG